jgi:hypothetical protein
MKVNVNNPQKKYLALAAIRTDILLDIIRNICRDTLAYRGASRKLNLRFSLSENHYRLVSEAETNFRFWCTDYH